MKENNEKNKDEKEKNRRAEIVTRESLGAVGVGGQGDDVAEAGAQGHHTEDGGGVNRSAALLGDGDRDALLGDGLDEGGSGTGVQTDLGSDGGGDLGHVKLLVTCGV